jgi:hypothetical protein
MGKGGAAHQDHGIERAREACQRIIFDFKVTMRRYYRWLLQFRLPADVSSPKPRTYLVARCLNGLATLYTR